MKRNWIHSSIAMLLFSAPVMILAQTPPVESLPNLGDVIIPAPVIAPAVDPTAKTFAYSYGDVLTWRAAEPTSPSDSLNNPAQSAPISWTTQAAAPAARDGFEERIARLEAQVAALSQQLRSGHAVAMAPSTTHLRTYTMAPTTRAAQVAPLVPTPPAAPSPRASRNPAATATVAPGAPIVIHVYVHPGSAPAAPAAPSVYHYQLTPAVAAPATPSPEATRVRARIAIPATSATPAVAPRVFAVPLTPGVPGIPGIPAAPAVPAAPATIGVPSIRAVPATPSAPAALPAAPLSPSATTDAPALAPASRLAWDDVPNGQ